MRPLTPDAAPPQNEERTGLVGWIGRVAAGIFIACYLGAIGWFLCRHTLEGSAAGPAAYFWTWDMFPHYETESVRRTILAETADGKFVQLLPDAADRFRWGNHDDCTRFDLDRRDPTLRRVVAQAIARDRAKFGASDPARIARVLVAERYWPVRWNAADLTPMQPGGADVNEAVDPAFPGSSPAHHRRDYWRVAAEAEVEADGELVWKPVP